MNHSFNKIGFPPCYTYWESKSPSFNFPVRKQNTKCYVKASFTLIKGAREQETNVNVSCWPSPWGKKDRNKIRKSLSFTLIQEWQKPCLIFVIGTTGGTREKELCHVEKFIQMTDCHVDKFYTYDILSCGQKFSTWETQKLCNVEKKCVQFIVFCCILCCLMSNL